MKNTLSPPPLNRVEQPHETRRRGAGKPGKKQTQLQRGGD